MCICVSLRLVDLNNNSDGLWLAKINAVVLNKATHDTFYSIKKVKVDWKDTDSYLRERSSGWRSEPRHFFKSQKGWKKGYMEIMDSDSLET